MDIWIGGWIDGLVDGKMDYRLKETSLADVPHEALKVARSLNINDEWISLAEKELEKNKN